MVFDLIHATSKVRWINDENIRPYIYHRNENRIEKAGTLHRLNWFSSFQPIEINPHRLQDLEFAEKIYDLETKAFGPSNLAMPRWVFYDCAVMPGFVAGYAMRTSALPAHLKAILRSGPDFPDYEWTPLSLFIIIPTMHKGEWVAHNLCSINSLLPKESQFYGIGFLSKAFGLWYANVEYCSGMTQWQSPARKLHSHFGHMEILSSYSPVHSIAETLTYRVKVRTECWEQFFTRESDLEFLENYRTSSYIIDPCSKENLISMQHRLENGEGPFFLSAEEIAQKSLSDKLTVYISKKGT
jgi:hypothetical protein